MEESKYFRKIVQYSTQMYSNVLPFVVIVVVEDDQVPLYGDGDGHEDAGGEEDVVEGVEKVGEEVVVVLGKEST